MAAGEQNPHYYQVINLLIILIGLFLFSPQESFCTPLSYNGTIRYSEDQDGQSQQGNSHNISYAQAQEVTQVLSLNESVRFSKNWIQGRGSTESYFPQVMLTANNYLFNWVMSASMNEVRGASGVDSSKRSWDSSWSSNWEQHDVVPSIRLNFGQDVAETDDNPRTIDTKAFRTGIGLDWAMRYGKLSCDYSYSNDFNKRTQRVDAYDNFSLLMNSSKAFFQNNLNISLSQKINKQHRETSFKSGTSDNNVPLIQVNILQTLYQNDSTPLSGSLGDQPKLMDGVIDKSAITVFPGETINLGIKVNTQQVDKIYVYTLQDLSNSKANLSFDLYSSIDGISWTIEKSSIDFIYASDHFEIEIPRLKKMYLKIVSLQNLITSIDITELKALQILDVIAGDIPINETDFDNFVTTIGLNYNFSLNTSFNYNFLYEIGNQSTGDNFIRIAHSASLNVTSGSHINTRINASEFSQDFDLNPSTQSRSYGVTISYEPISTIDMNIGVNRSESYLAAIKKSTTQNYIFAVNAGLYRDLDSIIEFRYNETKQGDAQGDVGNYSTLLRFTARLNPNITSNLAFNYVTVLGEAVGESDLVALKYDINWRTSDFVSMQAEIIKEWASTVDASKFRLSCDVAPTSKTQISMSYSLDDLTMIAQNLNISARWLINSNFSWALSTNYNDTGNSYQYFFDTILIFKF